MNHSHATTHPLYSWLTHQHSLTDKLTACFPAVRLQVIQHTWKQAAGAADYLERKILMWAGLERCWFARTQIPAATYYAEEALFSRLSQQALGELIWHNPNIQRIKLQPFSLTPLSPEYALLEDAMHEQRCELLGRHSTLLAQQRYPFYLVEIFLPGLERLIT